ncbi:hypothetical protein TNCV_129401 [Trichonephila clavipes]|nr:hypothetical protein TNCV_129401 [Trichonephila clavipes]
MSSSLRVAEDPPCRGGRCRLNLSRLKRPPFGVRWKGHFKSLRFFHGAKTFPICTKCNVAEVTPQHLLDCVELSITLINTASFGNNNRSNPAVHQVELSLDDGLNNIISYIIKSILEFSSYSNGVLVLSATRNLLTGATSENNSSQSKILTSFVSRTATAGSDVVQSGRPIFDDFFSTLVAVYRQ